MKEQDCFQDEPLSSEEKLRKFVDIYNKARENDVLVAMCGSCALYLLSKGYGLEKEFRDFRVENGKGDCYFSDIDVFVNPNNFPVPRTHEIFGVDVISTFDPMFGHGPPIEYDIFLDDRHPVTEVRQPVIVRHLSEPWEFDEVANGLVHLVDEGPCGLQVVPFDIVQDIDQVVLRHWEVEYPISPSHSTSP